MGEIMIQGNNTSMTMKGKSIEIKKKAGKEIAVYFDDISELDYNEKRRKILIAGIDMEGNYFKEKFKFNDGERYAAEEIIDTVNRSKKLAEWELTREGVEEITFMGGKLKRYW